MRGICRSIFFVSAWTMLSFSMGCKGSIRSQPELSSSRLIANENQIVKLSSTEPAITNRLEIPIKIVFSSPVRFFDNDIAVSGGTIHQCTKGIQTVFNCTLIPKSKNVSLKIISGTIRTQKGTDAGGSNVLSFVVDAADPVYGLCIKKSEFESKFQTLRF